MKNKRGKYKLRYGENPNQNGYLINHSNDTIFNHQINGKKISYNNLIDLDSGLRCLEEFDEPTSIILSSKTTHDVEIKELVIKMYLNQKNFIYNIKDLSILLVKDANERFAEINYSKTHID